MFKVQLGNLFITYYDMVVQEFGYCYIKMWCCLFLLLKAALQAKNHRENDVSNISEHIKSRSHIKDNYLKKIIHQDFIWSNMLLSSYL